jgi:hypothetical protein
MRSTTGGLIGLFFLSGCTIHEAHAGTDAGADVEGGVVMTGPLQDIVTGTVAMPGFGLVQPDGSWQQMLSLPPGSTLRRAKVLVDPTDGHHPFVVPTVTVWAKNIATNEQRQVAKPVEDPTPAGSAYDAPHGFGPSGLQESVDASTTVYWVVVTGEGGANKAALRFLGTSASFD